jgi:hypothetical protein
MCARRVSLQRKPNSVAEFTRTIEKAIIPSTKHRTDIEKFLLYVASVHAFPGVRARRRPSVHPWTAGEPTHCPSLSWTL